MFYIRFNEISNLDLFVYAMQRPNISIAKPKYNETELEGADGSQYEDSGLYEDQVISIDFNFEAKNNDNVRKMTKRIRDWLKLKTEDNELILSDNREYYYKVKKLEISDFTYDNDFYTTQKFTVKFTCDPYEYLQEGKDEIAIDSIIENLYDTCKPIYTISGQGNCILNVNGKQGSFTVDNKLTINTAEGSIYNNENVLSFNKHELDNFQDLFFKPGENKLNWTYGFDIKIIPNWRTI